MKNLPVDLIRPIIEQVQDRGTLFSLCLSSKILQPEAQRMLYFSPFGLLSSPSQQIRLLTSLLHHPRLALLVEVYHVMLIAGSEKATFGQLLHSVLPTMINLKVLSILARGEDLNSLPMDRLVFQLEALSWIQLDEGDSQQFARWLDGQKALKELKWICKSPVVVSPSACPNLISLEGNVSVVTAFLPNHHIQRLYGLKLSSLANHSGPINTFQLLVDQLPSLISLEFIGDGEEFIDDIPVPPSLQVLILSVWKGYGGRFPMGGQPNMIERLFSSSNLVRVDVAAQFVGDKMFYERWEHGILREGLVSSRDVFQGRRIFTDEY